MSKMSRFASGFMLVFILALGAFFRFYDLRTLPPGLWPDEAMNGTNALQALHTGEFKLFYPENNGREGLFINIQTFSVWLFGTSAWALRVVSALFGTLTILGLYLLTKELFFSISPESQNSKVKIQNDNSKIKITPTKWATKLLHFAFCILPWRNGKPGTTANEKVALLASFFLATSYWHINFSRIGFRAIMLPLLLSFGMYWLLKGLRTGHIWSLVLGGIFIGAGFHSYIAFRFVPFIIAVPIVWYWRQYQIQKSKIPRPSANGGAGKNQNDNSLGRPLAQSAGQAKFKITNTCIPCAVTLFLFITFVVALPMGLYFLKHPDDFFGRSKEVSVFSDPNPLRALALSTAKTLQMFNGIGDCNPRHNFRCSPELFWPVGIFFLIGAGLCAKKLFRLDIFSNPDSFPALIITTIFFIMLFPVILTREGLPHALRSIGLILPAIILAGWGAVWLYGAVQNYFSRAAENPKYEKYHNQLLRIKKEIVVLAFALLAFIAATTYQTYFVKFATARETDSAFRTDLTRIANYILSLPTATNVYVLANYPDLRYGLPLETEVIKYRTDTVRKEEQDAKHIHYLMPNELDTVIKLLQTEQKTIFIPMNQVDRAIFSELKKLLPQFSLKVANNFIVLQN